MKNPDDQLSEAARAAFSQETPKVRRHSFLDAPLSSFFPNGPTASQMHARKVDAVLDVMTEHGHPLDIACARKIVDRLSR